MSCNTTDTPSPKCDEANKNCNESDINNNNSDEDRQESEDEATSFHSSRSKPALQPKLSDPTAGGRRAPSLTPVMRASSNPTTSNSMCRHYFNSSMNSPVNSPEPYRRRMSEFSFTEGFNRLEGGDRG